jgi:hypothetical protein
MMSFTGDTQPVVPLGDVNRFHEEFAGLSRAEPSGLENDVRDKTSMHMEFDQPRGHDDDNLSKEALHTPTLRCAARHGGQTAPHHRAMFD